MAVQTLNARTQFERIAGLCARAWPNRELLMVSDPDSAFLRFQVKSFRRTLYESDEIPVRELAAMSDDELWELLEDLSHRLIRHPAS